MQEIYLSVRDNFSYHESNYDSTELYNKKDTLQGREWR